jgi:molybdenum cofactor synthesis domain-containing protein
MTQPSAAMLVIGDEILSGRTQDKNINTLACFLHDRGIALSEVRVIGDRHEVIVAAVKALSAAYDLVFTSGGIGPTHDDITTEAVAGAFSVPVIRHPEANRLLIEHYQGTGLDYNAARQKMADVPDGAELIYNPVSAAPGYRISNVHVMAGVPKIFEAMLAEMDAMLPMGMDKHRVSIQTEIGEGTLASGLGKIENRYEGMSIGSYPWFKPGQYGTAVVVASLNQGHVDAAAAEVLDLITSLGGTGTMEQTVSGGNSA